jgi:RNA polymerase sigma-70 factor (ECF subfamily)
MARMGYAAAESGSSFQGQEAACEDGVTPLLTRAVEHARAGDPEAIAFLYARCADDVCRYAQGVLGEAREAEELTLRVFAELPLAIGNHSERDAPFQTWLLRLARRIVVDHIRERRAIEGRSGLGFGVLAENGSGRGVDALREALAKLPFDEHEVLVLRHFGGLSPTDIARLTGRSERGVRGLHRSGREALRAQLSHQRALRVSAGS